MPFDQRSDDLVTEPFGSGIHRQYFPGRERIGVTVGIRENDIFPGSHLTAMIEADRARDEECLPHRYAAIQERLPRPDAFQESAVIPTYRVEEPETPSGGQHSLGHHLTHTGHLLAQSSVGQRG